MSGRTKAILATALLIWHANAQAQCSTYVNTVPAYTSFAELFPLASSIPIKKGEFETTAEFNARRAAAGFGKTYILRRNPSNRDGLVYDADKEEFTVNSNVFYDYGVSYDGAISGSTFAKTHADNLWESHDRAVEMERSADKLHALYEGVVTKRAEAPMFHGHPQPVRVGIISMPRPAAQTFKPVYQIAFAFKPNDPFVLQRSYTGVFLSTVASKLIIGELTCGLIIHHDGRVVAAYAAGGPHVE